MTAEAARIAIATASDDFVSSPRNRATSARIKMRSPLSFAIGLFIAVRAHPLVVRAQAVTPLPVSAITSLNTFSRLWPIGSLSPDGRWMVYAVRSGDDVATGSNGEGYTRTGMSPSYASGNDLWIADTKSGTSERITDGKGLVEQPVWSPDGRFVAFVSDRDGVARVWTWEQRTKTLRRVSAEAVRP